MIFDSLAVTSISAAAVVPVILAITQAIKMATGDRLRKWAPIISLALGVAASFLFNHDHDMTMGDQLMSGIIYGLSASGLYSGTKSTSEAVKGENGNTNF